MHTYIIICLHMQMMQNIISIVFALQDWYASANGFLNALIMLCATSQLCQDIKFSHRISHLYSCVHAQTSRWG